ncbi:pentapeptide repeat-containing protein [Actinosynnema sp. NPDC004786]
MAVLVWLGRWIDGLALTDADKRATAQLDALKLAASIVVGGGGLFALYLAARRQRTQEQELEVRHAELAQRDRVQVHAEQVAEANRLHAEQVATDARLHAEAQRITELYTKASEQLGSDKAPVRLAGLYALERLAQDNPHQRQTVVNVLCAYLRMPYTLPGEPPAGDIEGQIRARYSERVQEREVRLAAQRILVAHLRPGGDLGRSIKLSWPDTDLDLSGSTLIDFDFSHCRPRNVDFRGTLFTGVANFRRANFLGYAAFSRAIFTERALFDGVRFDGKCWFNDAVFTKGVRFDAGEFTKVVRFDRVRFGEEARFDSATFSEKSWFIGSEFLGEPWRGATFDSATFVGDVQFDGAIFAGHAQFTNARFVRDVAFANALTAHPVAMRLSWPAGWHPAIEHAEMDGRGGTWHRLIRSDPGDTAA